MEHSLLHAIGLWGLLVVIGGPMVILGLPGPFRHPRGPNFQGGNRFINALETSSLRCMIWGAAVAALAALLDLFVQTAEVRGNTLFGGVALSDLVRLATQTTVGTLSLARAGILFLIALIAWNPWWRALKWWLLAPLAIAALVLTALVSHAAAQPTGRTMAIFLQLAHLAGVAIWLGMLFHFLAFRGEIERINAVEDLRPLAEMVRRFSPVALIAVSILMLSGVFAAWRFLASTGALLTSSYGLTLVIKLIMLLPALYAGLVNYRVIRPELMALVRCNSISGPSVFQRFGRMLELEVTIGLLVVALAGILASIPPPGSNSTLRLTDRQVGALITPQLPTGNIPNPAGFYGAPKRTLDDLRYSEFTHHFSGTLVCLLGFCWLGQSGSGKMGRRCGRTWPWLLMPFAAFVTVASDPEVWWLHRVSPWSALTDPQLLEHQLGAVLILALAWLGWRDKRQPEWRRPLWICPSNYAMILLGVCSCFSRCT